MKNITLAIILAMFLVNSLTITKATNKRSACAAEAASEIDEQPSKRFQRTHINPQDAEMLRLLKLPVNEAIRTALTNPYGLFRAAADGSDDKQMLSHLYCWSSAYSNKINLDSPIIVAVKSGNPRTVSALLNIPKTSCASFGRETIYAADEYSRTALHHACIIGNSKIVAILLDNPTEHINPNALDIDKQTALHYACSEGHLEIVQLLLQKDFIILYPSLIRQAFFNTNIATLLPIIELLLTRGLDLNTLDDNKETPLRSYLSNADDISLQTLTQLLTLKSKGLKVFIHDCDLICEENTEMRHLLDTATLD